MQAVCTPDCVLMQPIEVCGQLVNWIDSKACFGDAETLAENFGQFSRYVNEVGPGKTTTHRHPRPPGRRTARALTRRHGFRCPPGST